MSKKQKKHIFGVVFVVAILLVAIMSAPEWISIYETDYCSNLKNETITEITMLQTTDSAVKVVFHDEDLIREWVEFFDSAVVKFNWKNTYFPKRMVGGQPFLKVQTNQGSYSFGFNPTADGLLIGIGNKRYVVKEPEDVRFDQIYEAAAERHGTISVFSN